MFTKILCIAVIAVTIAQASPVGEEGVQSKPAQKAEGDVGASPFGFLSDGLSKVIRVGTDSLSTGVQAAQKVVGDGQSALGAVIPSIGSGKKE